MTAEGYFWIRDPFAGWLTVEGETLDEAIDAFYSDIEPEERPAYVWYEDEQIPVPGGGGSTGATSSSIGPTAARDAARATYDTARADARATYDIARATYDIARAKPPPAPPTAPPTTPAPTPATPQRPGEPAGPPGAGRTPQPGGKPGQGQGVGKVTEPIGRMELPEDTRWGTAQELTAWAEERERARNRLTVRRMGDYYEAFGADASILARICGLRLRAVDRAGKRIASAGFIVHDLARVREVIRVEGWSLDTGEPAPPGRS